MVYGRDVDAALVAALPYLLGVVEDLHKDTAPRPTRGKGQFAKGQLDNKTLVNLGAIDADFWHQHTGEILNAIATAEFTEEREKEGKRPMTDLEKVTRQRDVLAQAMKEEITQLECWARESLQEGWSTHQVRPMRERAEKLAFLVENHV